MKTLEEFQSFYESDLRETLNELELDRKKAVKLVPLVILGVAGLIGGIVGLTSKISPILFGLVLGASVLLIIISLFKIFTIKKPMKAKYKEEVIREMVLFLSNDLSYSQHGYISESDYNKSKIFLKTADRYAGDDLVEGKIGETSVRFSELKTEYYTTNSKGQRQYHTLFKGVFFIADFNKHFVGETMVLADTAESMFGKLGTMLQKMNVSRPKLVKLEDPVFEKEFAVYGTDQVEARYILTPAMMSRIIDFRQKTGKVSMSFIDSNVYIAIKVSKNLFEPPFYKSMLDFELVKEYFNYLVLCLDIVEDLDLNTRIWTKE